MGIFEKFKIGFKKSASTFTSGLRDIIVKKEIDDKTLDQVEEYLIESDVGVDSASEIKKIISSEKIDPKKETINEVNLILKNYIIKLMRPLENNNFFKKNDKLKIVLISGVNGVGKTTTIGKIGKIVVADSRFARDGRFIEKLGFFNPLLPKEKKERLGLETDRIKYWISQGAKPTIRVARILGEKQIIPMPANSNNPQKALVVCLYHSYLSGFLLTSSSSFQSSF